ncbi:hybrid sensor histidine kinase/response regulator [Caballeronia zhejiangensis]|jgi:PAS domain S-box-containing protein|uniref:hybrid sensor histidine kinase/response regulator n=1 Tax=Caballeronia zhejiangensis TaxID=871203 RepID=UPI001FD57974|nr:hybrid sensor histidine kinase/response regulator [Caballeronia zhejiangensis]
MRWDADTAYGRAPCGLLTATAGGKVLHANHTFYSWLGLSASEVVGVRRFQDFLTIGGEIFMQTHVMPLLEMQRSVAEVKLDLRSSDGRVLPMLVNVSRVSEGEQELDEFAVMIVGDRHKYERELVHARQRLEESLKAKDAAELALRSADRRKDEFLATLAHELRNPLGAMRSAIDVLRRPELTACDMSRPLEVLAGQLAQASRLTDDLLDASRIAEGKLEIKKVPVEIGAILQEVAESTRARHFATGATHELETTMPTETIYVFADPVRLAQVVQNLLNNALRYTPTGGKIWLSAIRDGDSALVTVRDNGVGIPPEDLPTIFQMFAQAPSGRGRLMGGLGVGLALVQALVEMHQGQVTVESQGPGYGSTFEVRLPALQDEHTPPPLPTPDVAPSAWTQRRVLVVDDNEGAASSLMMLLELEGHFVRTENTGLGALRAVEEFAPEAVILDLGLPDVHGSEVARRIRNDRGSNIALIALTGWAPDANDVDTQSPFNAYFIKPIDLDRLLSALERISTL